MDFSKVIDKIENLNHYREVKCSECGQNNNVHILEIYMKCSACGREVKMRGFSSFGSEIEDVIDSVLEWVGDGPEFEAVMKRYKEILSATKSK